MKCPKCSGRVVNDCHPSIIDDVFVKCINCGWMGGHMTPVTGKKGKCLECGREDLTIAAKGLCWSCYEKAKTGKAPKLGPQYDQTGAIVATPSAVKSEVPPVKIETVTTPVATITKTTFKSSNPLLPPAVECRVVLNFDGKGDLLTWLKDNEVTPDHIIELLDTARTVGLERAA